MKTRVLAVALVALLATASTAVAGTNTLTGKYKNYPEGKITIKIKTNKKGVAKKVTAINVSNAPSTCTDARFNKIPNKKVSAKLGGFKIKKVVQSGKTYYTVFFGGKVVDGVGFNGEMQLSSKKGRKVTGTLSFNFNDAQGSNSCGGGGSFTVKVKKK